MIHISQILWSIDSILHISTHGVTPEEVEEAVYDGNPLILRGRENRYVVLSRSGSGRYLTIVVAFKVKGRVSVITARDMDKKERNFYKRRGK